MWKPIYNPGSWQSFLKRGDNLRVPLMEVRKKYLEEQYLWSNTLNPKIPLTDHEIVYNWPQTLKSDEGDFYGYVKLDTPDWFEELVEPGGSSAFSYVPMWYHVDTNNMIYIFRYSSGQATGRPPHWRLEEINIDENGNWAATNLTGIKQGDTSTPLGTYKLYGDVVARVTEGSFPLFEDYICLNNVPSASSYHSLHKATLEGFSSLYNGIPYYTSSFEGKDYGVFFDIFKSPSNLSPYWYLGTRNENPSPITSPEDDYDTFISWSSDLDVSRDPEFTLTPKGDDEGKVDINLEYCVDSNVPEGSETYLHNSTLFIAHVSENEADTVNANVNYDYAGQYLSTLQDETAGLEMGTDRYIFLNRGISEASLKSTGSANISTPYTSDDFFATVLTHIDSTQYLDVRVEFPITITTGSVTIYWGDGEEDTLTGDEVTITHTYPLKQDKVWPLVIKGNCESLIFDEVSNTAPSLQIIYQWGTVCERTSIQGNRARKFSYMREPMPSPINLSEPARYGPFNGDLGLFNMWWVSSEDVELEGTKTYPVDVSNWTLNTPVVIDRLFYAAVGNARVKMRGIGEWDATPSDFNRGFEDLGDYLVISESFSGWDLSQCTRMTRTFYSARLTHIHDIEGWDTSNVTDFSECFKYSSQNSYDLSGWDITSALNDPSNGTFSSMFLQSGFTAAHLSSILVSWKNQVDTLGFTGVKTLGQLPVTFSSLSTEAQSASTYLTSTLGWSISYI